MLYNIKVNGFKFSYARAIYLTCFFLSAFLAGCGSGSNSSPSGGGSSTNSVFADCPQYGNQANVLIEVGKGTRLGFWGNNGRNLLILHGICSSETYFSMPKSPNDFVEYLKTHGNYSNILFYNYASGNTIGQNSAWLANEISVNNPNVKFDVVSHSKGGLVARWLNEQFFLKNPTIYHDTIEKLIMVATPNFGVPEKWLSNFFGSLYLHDYSGDELILNSRSLQILNPGYGGSNQSLNHGNTKYFWYTGNIALGDTTGCSLNLVDGYWYCLDGRQFPSDPSDGIVPVPTQQQVQYLNLSGQRTFVPIDINPPYDHSSLHTNCAINGVCDEILRALLTPSGVAAVAGNGQITISWNSIPGIASYNVFFASVTGVNKINYSTLPDGIKIAGVTSPLTQNGLTNGKTYYFVVTANTDAGQSQESSQISVTPQGPSVVSVSISPLTASIIVGGNIPFSANITGSANTSVNWSIQEGAAGGTITSGGVYTAPNTAGTYHVVATSQADPTKGGTATIIVSSLAPAWLSSGPDGGVITGGVISPSFKTDQTIFVVSQNRVLFKSINGGGTWMPVNTGINNRIGVVAISPNYAADQTLFAGTSNHSGILKSIDGGKTWTGISINLGMNVYVNVLTSLIVSPNYATDQTLFAGTATGIFKSINGGVTWSVPNAGFNVLLSSLAPSGPSVSLAISPSYVSDQTLFVGASGGGVFKSTDGGSTWATVNSSLKTNKLVISPSYVMDQTLFSTVGSTGAIYKSTNGGVTWTVVSSTLNCGCYDIILSPNFAGDKTIFAGTTYGLFKSIDGGASWTTVPGLSNIPVFFLAISPGYSADQTLFVGQLLQGGIYKSIDGGINWTAVNTGLIALYVLNISISPNYLIDNTIFVATDAGVYKSTNGGTTWVSVNSGLTGVNGLQIVSVSVSPNYGTDQTLFAGSLGVSKSTNGGTSWATTNLGLSNLQVLCLVLSPYYSTDKTIFAGTWGGVFKSTNGGLSWTAVNTGLSNLNIVSLITSPNYSLDQTIFAGTNGGVFKSINGGLSWTMVNSGLSGPFAISPNYGTDQTIFASGLYKSTNGGLSWVAVNTGMGALGITSYAISPNYGGDQTLFAGTYGGVYKSTDGGVNWTSNSAGLVNLNVSSLAVSPGFVSDNTLFAGTNGYSVWKY